MRRLKKLKKEGKPTIHEFGRDHWSLLAYVECVCTDGKEGIGTLDPDRMRRNENSTSHPAAPLGKIRLESRQLGCLFRTGRLKPSPLALSHA